MIYPNGVFASLFSLVFTCFSSVSVVFCFQWLAFAWCHVCLIFSTHPICVLPKRVMKRGIFIFRSHFDCGQIAVIKAESVPEVEQNSSQFSSILRIYFDNTNITRLWFEEVFGWGYGWLISRWLRESFDWWSQVGRRRGVPIGSS